MLDIEKFCNYTNRWEKKNHKFNTVKNQVSWELIKNDADVWAHKQCKETFFKNDYLHKQINTTSNENEKSETIHSEITRLKQPKFQLNFKVPEKGMDTCHHWKNKDLMKCIICDGQKRKKGRPLPLVNTSWTEKAEKTLLEYSELHVKNNNAKYIDGANQILLVLNTKSLLATEVAYHSSCYEAFWCTVWKNQLHKTSDEKQKISEKWWSSSAWIFSNCENTYYITEGEVYSVADLGIYYVIRSERNLSSSTRRIDIRQNLQDMLSEKMVFKKISSSKTEFVMSKNTDKFVDIWNIQLMSSLPSSLTFNRLEKMISTSIKSTLIDKPWPPTPDNIISTKYNINKDLFNLIVYTLF